MLLLQALLLLLLLLLLSLLLLLLFWFGWYPVLILLVALSMRIPTCTIRWCHGTSGPKRYQFGDLTRTLANLLKHGTLPVAGSSMPPPVVEDESISTFGTEDAPFFY